MQLDNVESNHKFMHGDVFLTSGNDLAVLESRKYSRSRDRKVVRPRTNFKTIINNLFVASAITLTIAMTQFIPDVGVSSSSVYKVWDIEGIGLRLREAREYIGLSRKKASEILFVSSEAIKTIEYKSIVSPSHTNMVTYHKFTELIDIYKDYFKNDKKAAKSFFMSPGHAFGDVAPFEYIKKNGPRAISDVLAIHRRMLA